MQVDLCDGHKTLIAGCCLYHYCIPNRSGIVGFHAGASGLLWRDTRSYSASMLLAL